MYKSTATITTLMSIICLVSSVKHGPMTSKEKDDVVVRICKSNPHYTFCRQYIDGEMGEPSMVPFPHLNEPKEGSKKRLLLIKNEFNDDGTVKMPPNITLDPAIEQELARIKKVDHSKFIPTNNWGFEPAPQLKPDAKLLPEANKTSPSQL